MISLSSKVMISLTFLHIHDARDSNYFELSYLPAILTTNKTITLFY